MKSVETSAKTRKEAIQMALDKLRCELHEVNIEILDEGSRGILGLGARPVRVRVSAEHLHDEPAPRERPRPTDSGGRRERPRKGRGERGGERREGGAERKGRGDRERGPKPDRGGERRENRPRREEGNGKRERDRDRGRGRGGEDRGGQGRPERERRPAPQASDQAPAEARRRPEREPLDPEVAAAMGKTAAGLLADIIDKMGMASTVTSRVDDDGNIVLDVKTEDTAILIGRKGRNLQSLQFLINRIMLQQEENDALDRIIVDIEGYLDRRKTELEEMARELATEAVDSGRTVRVRPLSPPERRIIHVTLSGDDRVKTISTGTGHRRQVIIVPAGAREDNERRGGGSGGGRGGRGGSRSRGGRGGARRGKPTRSHANRASETSENSAGQGDDGPRNDNA